MARYPIRARKRPGRVGLYRSLSVVGGAFPEPPVTTPVAYTIMGGGYYPAIGMGILVFELLCFI